MSKMYGTDSKNRLNKRKRKQKKDCRGDRNSNCNQGKRDYKGRKKAQSPGFQNDQSFLFTRGLIDMVP